MPGGAGRDADIWRLEGHRTERSRVSRAVRAATPDPPSPGTLPERPLRGLRWGVGWRPGPPGGGAAPALEMLKSRAFRPQISRRLSRSALAPPS